VAEPPPRIGGDYHVLQLLKMKVGKVSLEGVVQPGDGGSVLRVRARILVTGLDRAKKVHIFVDRRSTGVIEADFIHKLEARLGLAPLGAGPTVPVVAPFRALTYAPRLRPRLDRLVAPPYDVLGEEQRARLAEHDDHNIVHVDLPRAPAGEDPYEGAARCL